MITRASDTKKGHDHGKFETVKIDSNGKFFIIAITQIEVTKTQLDEEN